MSTDPETLSLARCPVCDVEQPHRVVENIAGGCFVECAGCGIQFAEADDTDLLAFYHEIWSEGNLGVDPYTEKVEAAHDPSKLKRLLRSVPRFRWAVRQLGKLPEGSRVLDVGCGEGALLWAAQRLGLRPHGCDLAAPAVELARELVAGANVQVGTINDLPCDLGTFDAVLALEVVEHLPNPRPFLERAAELLKPQGILLLTVPNRYRVGAVLKRTLGKPHSNTDYPPHHFTRWSVGSLRHLLWRRFREVRIGSLPYYSSHWAGRALAYPLHILSGACMGQSLWACARGPR